MKKILLSSAAAGVMALASMPAMAADGGVKLDLGGHIKIYGAYVDQDETAALEERSFDMLRETEIHFTGETTLDNGLTVGAHFEADADGDDFFQEDDAYIYMSGSWGRVNLGAEDGAAFLLQVAAPSADANYDGLRQFIQPVNYGITNAAALEDNFTTALAIDVDESGALSANDVVALNNLPTAQLFNFSYDNNPTGFSDKITYLTPVISGFQAGLSYTPEVNNVVNDNLEGVNQDDVAGEYGDAWEVGVRYEGMWDKLGFAVGAGYAHSEIEENQNLTFEDTNGNGALNAGEKVLSRLENREVWNAGLDLDYGPFGFGAAYIQDDLGIDNGGDRETWVFGADYTTGPYKLGVSYLTENAELSYIGPGIGDIETERYTGGVIYTYGPGMTFRGTVSYIENDLPTGLNGVANDDVEATSIMLGTQINF